MHQEKLKFLKGAIVFSGILLFSLVFNSCTNTPKSLPYYGEKDIFEKDTFYHEVPNFSFFNQDSNIVSSKDYDNQVYIVDFFFTTCPGICPIMTNELVRVQEEIKNKNLAIKILSHTVDPETDSVKVLKEYGEEKGADFSIWDFVTGEKQNLYQMATHYLVVANEDPNTEIHFVHSDKLVLVDKNNRIRGMYDGTDPEDVDRLIEEMKYLIK